MTGTYGHPNGQGIEGCAGLLTLYHKTPDIVGVALLTVYGVTCSPALAAAYQQLQAANDDSLTP